MRFHYCCVVLALALSSSTAMPGECTIPTVNHGKVGHYSSKIFENNRFRECFYQHPIGDGIHDGDSVILRCEKGYLPVGSTQISKFYRSKEDVVICEDGTWSKPLRCEVEITCAEPPPIEFATVTSLSTEDYPLGTIIAYQCQPGYIVKGSSTTSQCVMSDDGSQAIWSKAPMSCVAQWCGYPGYVIHSRRTGSNYAFPHTVQFECEEGYKLNGTDVRHCEASGIWSGKLPTCERIYCDQPRNPENGIVRYISLEYGTELRYECNKGFHLSNHQKRFCSGNGTWSNDEPLCTVDSSISSNMKEDDGCCTSNYLNTNVLSSNAGEQTLLGTKVKKGDSVEIGCKDRTAILVWRNGLRASGPVSLTCDTCQTWVEEDIPSCVPLSAAVTSIVLSRNMKLLPGGIVEIRQDENVQIQCSVLDKFSRMHFPAWRSSPPKNVSFSYDSASTDRGHERRALMLIDGFKAELTGRYECSTPGTHGYQYGPTLLNLKIAKAEIHCPILDEKDDFIISYSNSRKVNSIAVYICRKRTEEIRGKSFRTCLESGEWTTEENPSCSEITCGEPPPIEFATVTSLFTEDYPLGAIEAYECKPGYVVKGRSTTSQCVMSDDGSQAIWSKARMSCVAQPCGDPGFVINARRTGSDFTFPHTVQFECEEGYKLNGTDVRHCEASGMWSGKLPTCERIYCDEPRNTKNGIVRYTSLEYGTELRYECNKGFNPSNHQHRICSGNGTWSNDEPICTEINCDEAKVPKHGFRQLTDGLKIDSLVIYSCEEGKILVGANTSKCLSNGQWTLPPPKCLDQCEVPYVENGRIGQYERRSKYREAFVPFEEGEIVNPGEMRTLRCNEDFVLEEGSETSEKQVACEDGTWSAPLQCKSVSCHGEPPAIKNGHPIVTGRTHGHVLYYRCQDFCYKTVAGRVECVYGKWKGYTPVCTDARCYTSQLNFPGLVMPEVEFIDHKRYFGITCEEGYQVTGQRRKISCEMGEWKIDYNPCIKEIRCPVIDEKGIFTVRYDNDRKVNSASYYLCREPAQKMTGTNVRTCQENGEWSGVDPVCESVRNCSIKSSNSPSALIIDPKKDFYHLGEFIELSCPAVFDLTTEVERVMCLGSSGWSDPLPDCKKI